MRVRPMIPVLGLLCAAALSAPVMAAGGTGGGGAGGSGGATTTIGGQCVKVNALAVSADQSIVTSAARLLASYSVTRCGGNVPTYTLRISAATLAGSVVWSTTDAWTPIKNLPYAASRATDAALFATTYAVRFDVINPSTGAVVAGSTAAVSTPLVRIAPCAAVVGLNASVGYAPGTTTVGAVWSSYTVKNCGGSEWLDIDITETNVSTHAIEWRVPWSGGVAGSATEGIGLTDYDAARTGATYDVKVTVRRHSSGEVLSTNDLVVTTPVSR